MPSSERPDNPKTVRLTEQDIKDAARLLKLFAGSAAHGDFFERRASPNQLEPSSNRQELVQRAEAELHGRRARRQFFDPELFGEPAWEILLALYTAEHSGARFTTGKLSEFIAAPLSTVVRWVKALEELSLVERADHPTDRRIIFIQLHRKGAAALDAYFGAILSQDLSQS